MLPPPLLDQGLSSPELECGGLFFFRDLLLTLSYPHLKGRDKKLWKLCCLHILFYDKFLDSCSITIWNHHGTKYRYNYSINAHKFHFQKDKTQHSSNPNKGPESHMTEEHISFRALQGKKQIRRYFHHCKRIRNKTETRRQKKKKVWQTKTEDETNEKKNLKGRGVANTSEAVRLRWKTIMPTRPPYCNLGTGRTRPLTSVICVSTLMSNVLR